jgi:glycosyltransferase involved in cell wall biosynthesis
VNVLDHSPAVLLMGDTLRVGGTEGQFVELACRLDRSRWRVEVGCIRPEGPLRARLDAEGIRPWATGPSSFKSPGVVAAVAALRRRIQEARIVLVHSFDFYSNLLALPAARLAGVRAAVASQRDLGDLRPRAQGVLHRRCLRLATHVAVNSDAVRERVEAHGIDPRRVVVLENGVDLSRFRPADKGRARTSRRVGVLSNLRPEKGLSDLVRAMALVRERRPDVELVIWGDGPMREELDALLRSLALDPALVLRGTTSGPDAALRDMDVFVLPSLSEASSNGLMEAMATGLPVIATAVGGNPRLVQHEVTGLLTPAADTSALAATILRLLEDGAFAARLGARARAHAESTFGMDQMVARTEAFYAEAPGPGRGSGAPVS